MRVDSILAAYDTLGYNLIPIQPPVSGDKQSGKRPALLSWQAYQTRNSTDAERDNWWPTPIWTPGIDKNYGVVTGRISNLIVLDLDDMQTVRDFIKAMPWLQDTLMASTGKGMHFYLRPRREDEPVPTTAFKWNEGTHHIKGEGGYVVGPPSMHYTGKSYEWVRRRPALTIETDFLRSELAKIGITKAAEDDRPAYEAGYFARLLGEGASSGERHDTMIRLAGHLTGKFRREAPDEVLAILELWNECRVDPPLPQSEIERAVHDFHRT